MYMTNEEYVKAIEMRHSRRAYQSRPALLPEYGSIDTEKPSAPYNLQVKTDSLTGKPVITWECSTDSVKEKNKVRFYAVYMFDEGEPVDVENTDALLGFTPDSFYTMPSYQDIFCKQIAVTAIDRMHTESDALFMLYDPEAAQ